MSDIAHRCDFNVNDWIDAKYLVIKSLGEGSFGKVFKVKDRAGRVFALKLLKLWEIPPGIRQQLAARFDMEYETGRIKSHYLVHSISHGLVSGNPYIVMEYCANGDLLQWVNSKKPDMAKIGREILYGLKDLHRCGKVHRDLKPENVLIREDGSAVLTDFGISGDRNKKMTERNIWGKPAQIFGTYAYMPPEQVQPPSRDATVLPTTDIFSFGVMMYQLLTDRLPFGKLKDENDLVVYIRNGKEGKWDRKKLAASSKGALFLPIIEGCLIPNYKQRLQTVDIVLERMPKTGVENFYRSQSPDVQAQMIVKNGLLLRVMQGEEFGNVYKLNSFLRNNRRIITVGRNDASVQNALALVENQSCYISRKHCTLEKDQMTEQWRIRDGQWERNSAGNWKQSMNGTFVNSTEVTAQGMPIRPGDVISIGEVKMRVEGY